MNYLVAYLVTLAVYLVLDYAWLRGMMQPRLGRHPGGAFRSSVRPGPMVGFGFYYAGVLTVLAVLPGLFFLEAREQPLVATWTLVALLGGMLGLMAYGVRGFGNLALLRGWDWSTALLDLAWGAIVSAIAALAGYGAASSWAI